MQAAELVLKIENEYKKHLVTLLEIDYAPNDERRYLPVVKRLLDGYRELGRPDPERRKVPNQTEQNRDGEP